MIEIDALNEKAEEVVELDGNADEASDEVADAEAVNDELVTEDEDAAEDNAVDYDAIAANDLAELKRAFPELKDVYDVSELNNPMRYAALRDLGLSAEEAYLATRGRRDSYDNRAHLTPSVPGGASVMREMSRNDYNMAREIFSDMSDAEIRKLYRKVTK